MRHHHLCFYSGAEKSHLWWLELLSTGLYSLPILHPHPGRQHLNPSICNPAMVHYLWDAAQPWRFRADSNWFQLVIKLVVTFQPSQQSNRFWASISIKQTQYNHPVNMLLLIKWDNTRKELGTCTMAKYATNDGEYCYSLSLRDFVCFFNK